MLYTSVRVCEAQCSERDEACEGEAKPGALLRSWSAIFRLCALFQKQALFAIFDRFSQHSAAALDGHPGIRKSKHMHAPLVRAY